MSVKLSCKEAGSRWIELNLWLQRRNTVWQLLYTHKRSRCCVLWLPYGASSNVALWRLRYASWSWNTLFIGKRWAECRHVPLILNCTCIAPVAKPWWHLHQKAQSCTCLHRVKDDIITVCHESYQAGLFAFSPGAGWLRQCSEGLKDVVMARLSLSASGE